MSCILELGFSKLRRGGVLGLAAIALTASLVASLPARADDDDGEGEHHHGHRWQHRDVVVVPQPYYVAPGPVYVVPQPYYAAPPPVAYTPPVVYSDPSITFVFPIRVR